MSIEDTSLYNDVINLATGPEYATHKIFTCTLIAGEKQVDTISVNSITFDRDYQGSYGDSTIIEVMLPAGTYTDEVYPDRQNLYALLNITDTTAKGELIDNNLSSIQQRFRATIIDAISPSVVDVSESSDSKALANIGTLMALSLQLTDEVLETIRQTNFQTIIRNTSLDNIIKGLLKGDFFNNDKMPKPLGVIMTPADNGKVYKQIVLAPTLSAIDVVDWLQSQYGVYNNSLGVYLQRKYWYVFPLYQTEQFKEDNTSLTVVSVPTSKMPGTEKTFDFKNNHLMIIATGDTSHIDNSDTGQRNLGNGRRYINAERVIDNFSDTKIGSTKISKKNNIIEFRSQDREDGNNYIPFSTEISKSNHSDVLSSVANNQQNLITVTWENSNPNMLLPGMAVRFLYREEGTVKKLSGTLINVRHYYGAVNPGILQNVHSSVTQLSILAQSSVKK